MGSSDEKDEKSSRALILKRRARFVAAALASVAATSGTALGVEACKGGGGDVPNENSDGGSTTTPTSSGTQQPPQACLSIAPDTDGSVNPQPCLSQQIDLDAADPQPCLKVAPDGG